MFNAPDIITNIPDIQQIYIMNDAQSDKLDVAIETMDDNIFLDSMTEVMVIRWEKMLNISPFDNDSLEDRRFRIKAKVMEKLPYSIRVIRHKLELLCPDGYVMIVSDDKTNVGIKLALKSKKMINDVRTMMEDVLPLNMLYKVNIIWNQHITLEQFTHQQLSQRTHKEIREEIFE